VAPLGTATSSRPPQPRRPRSPPGQRLRPWPSPPARQARQLGSAPPAPPPNCRLLRRMYSSALQMYRSCSKRTRCVGPAHVLSRPGEGSRRRLRRSEHETALRAGSRAASEDAGGIRIEVSVVRSRRRSATLASSSGGGRESRSTGTGAGRWEGACPGATLSGGRGEAGVSRPGWFLPSSASSNSGGIGIPSGI